MTIEIRRPRADEMQAVGKLAAELLRFHHALDAERFLLLEPVEDGYTRFLTRMLADERSLVLVAVDADLGVVGYTYSRFEPRDYNRLLDDHAKVHDIAIDARARRAGVGRKLLAQTLLELRGRGALRIVAETAHANDGARSFFASMGFRPTMVEMLATSNGPEV